MNNQLLKAKDVSERLNISRSQAFALMRNGELPTVRFGRLVRVRPEDLMAFIAKNLTHKDEPTLKTKLAAATASRENSQVNHSQKEATHE